MDSGLDVSMDEYIYAQAGALSSSVQRAIFMIMASLQFGIVSFGMLNTVQQEYQDWHLSESF